MRAGPSTAARWAPGVARGGSDDVGGSGDGGGGEVGGGCAGDCDGDCGDGAGSDDDGGGGESGSGGNGGGSAISYGVMRAATASGGASRAATRAAAAATARSTAVGLSATAGTQTHPPRTSGGHAARCQYVDMDRTSGERSIAVLESGERTLIRRSMWTKMDVPVDRCGGTIAMGDQPPASVNWAFYCTSCLVGLSP